MDELIQQKEFSKIKGLLSAYGSGGTTAGMLLGAALINSKMKIYAVNVFDEDHFAREKIIQLVDDAIVVGEDALTHYQYGENSLMAAEGGAMRMQPAAPQAAPQQQAPKQAAPAPAEDGFTDDDIPF